MQHDQIQKIRAPLLPAGWHFVQGGFDAEVLGEQNLLRGGSLPVERLGEPFAHGLQHRWSQRQQHVPPVHAGNEAILEQRDSVRNSQGTAWKIDFILYK